MLSIVQHVKFASKISSSKAFKSVISCHFIALNKTQPFSSDVNSTTLAEKLVSSSPSNLQPYLRLMRWDRPIGINRSTIDLF